jgi:lactate dehydrogenase-like 2-hydroxyacid dehydrogenase
MDLLSELFAGCDFGVIAVGKERLRQQVLESPPWIYVDAALKTDPSGKRSLVTGLSGSIGYAIAKGLAEAGAWVIINSRSEKLVNEVKSWPTGFSGSKCFSQPLFAPDWYIQ